MQEEVKRADIVAQLGGSKERMAATKRFLRDILAQLVPEKHAKGSYAFNKFGARVNSTDPDACCWCIAGLFVVTPRPNTEFNIDIPWSAIEAEATPLPGPAGGMRLTTVNDLGDGLARVRGAVERVIRKLEEAA